MPTRGLGLPSELKRSLEYRLPRQNGLYSPAIHVTPRDSEFRKCAAYIAEFYEVQTFYTTTDLNSLDVLEEALGALPQVYMTTQVHSRGRNMVSNPEWPDALGASRRGFDELRPQVIALFSTKEK